MPVEQPTSKPLASGIDVIDHIRRAHASARPTPANPAWLNCHHDCGKLLAEIERLTRERDNLLTTNSAMWHNIQAIREAAIREPAGGRTADAIAKACGLRPADKTEGGL